MEFLVIIPNFLESACINSGYL